MIKVIKMTNKLAMSSRLAQALLACCVLVFVLFRYGLDSVQAARVSDVRGTKHNLSAVADSASTPSGGTVPLRAIKASTATEICVFCHTPHGASSMSAKPLWNRKMPGDGGYNPGYTMYSSSTLDATDVRVEAGPEGSSKLCLSCHDGLVAIGNVNVLSGMSNTGVNFVTDVIAMSPDNGRMPVGSGTLTGFTRNLGEDLRNDHPISITYNADLVNRDGELRNPSSDPTLIGQRTSNNKPKLKLEKTGPAGPNEAQVQCATCHDPHIRENDVNVGKYQKFLRLNRFQHKSYTGAPNPAFDPAINSGDIICVACHDKGGVSWTFSAHAHPDVADETYKVDAATVREFPTKIPTNNNPGGQTFQVWNAACLNCHDTHTVPGARRLLREGTNGGFVGAATAAAGGVRSGGSPALENTCYQCHTPAASSIIEGGTGGAPDIQTDFGLGRSMPISIASEVHDPNRSSTTFNNTAVIAPVAGTFINCTVPGSQCGKDLIESRENLGAGILNINNRHAECTDCHNPHRVIRARNGLPGGLTAANTQDARRNGASGGSHDHQDTTVTHTNIISGVLRGSWGVEPTYGTKSFHALPSGYNVKRGDPGGATETGAGQPYVTREYQICLKCHSDYGYTDNNEYYSNLSGSGNRPKVGAAGTPSGTNGLTMYTNQAREFQPASGHEGDSNGKNLGTEAGAGYNNNNHRSWHPVMAPTGRTAPLRTVTADNAFKAPWNNSVGTQTMYCTDCHGSATTGNTVIPNSTNPWGPHGSSNNFILKGGWDSESNATTAICIKCHSPTSSSGFYDPDTGSGGTGKGNLHAYHNTKVPGLECTWCHVAVPHGWKNRSLLVNLNDVGEEAGYAPGSSFEVAMNSTDEKNTGRNANYTREPYYLEAKLKIRTFAAPGKWIPGSCGSAGKSAPNLIAASNGNTTNGDSSGKQWMKSVCNPPP